ncbi:MAG TPA: response regulator [Verrucomicrobiae bacterium]
MNTATSSGKCPLPPSGESPQSRRASEGNAKPAKKILVIDDNRLVLKVTAYKLRTFGYEVHTAEDGAGAISILREARPDLILLDLNFPPDIAHGGGVPWDGLLLLSWLRRMNEAENIPVIAITAGDLPEYKDRCLAAGVLDIFLKPIDHEALVATIRRALNEAPRVQGPATPAARANPRGEPRPKPQPAPKTEAESTAGKKILFVDDESDWRYMGALYLTECGYEVVTTADGDGALAQASTLQPHLIVLDLNLGGQSGATLMKLLAAEHPQVPILIYTGTELDDSEVARLLDEGAYDCLRKGTMEELLNVVGMAIRGEPRKTRALPEPTTAPRVPDPRRKPTVEETPAAVEKTKDAPPEEEEAAPGRGGGSAREVAKPKTESALIIAEDAELKDALRSFLESRSFSVTCVIDGTEALNQIRTLEADLIVFDMAPSRLPVDQFYRALEGIKPHLCGRIIFITSDDTHPAADGFVRKVRGLTLWKPFPPADLLEAAETIRHRNSPGLCEAGKPN